MRELCKALSGLAFFVAVVFAPAWFVGCGEDVATGPSEIVGVDVPDGCVPSKFEVITVDKDGDNLPSWARTQQPFTRAVPKGLDDASVCRSVLNGAWYDWNLIGLDGWDPQAIQLGDEHSIATQWKVVASGPGFARIDVCTVLSGHRICGSGTFYIQ